jgi:outer membrane receptor protein involved in Fe transport
MAIAIASSGYALAPSAFADSSGDPEIVLVSAVKYLGPGLSAAGASDYSVSGADISALPLGEDAALSDVLAQMPGVAIDQNQQIHIRDTEGPQFQYQINGVLVPLDINTNPPFLSMINPAFVERLDLLTGVLPSRYSYATGGVVDIRTKDGCQQPGGSATLLAGQREMLEPGIEYGGCDGALSYFGSLLYQQSNTAFSSATPGANPVHDQTHMGQGFGILSWAINDNTGLQVIASVSDSNNQLPNVPGLVPQFALAGAPVIPSADINSMLDFRDYLGIVSLNGESSKSLSWQLSWSVHSLDQMFEPDDVGELIYQGVASTAVHKDFDNTFEGRVSYALGRHTLESGFYVGAYDVTADDSSLVFPLNAMGGQSSDVPINVVNNASKLNIVSGLYVSDLWQIDSRWTADFGIRWDRLSGFTSGSAFDPSLNLSFATTPDVTLHAGFARTMQVPSFLGISPDAPAAFAGTTAEGPPGNPTPVVERDSEWDAGVVYTPVRGLTTSADFYYELTKDYLDTGQFGVVPIFAPFNYSSGYMWGAEFAAAWRVDVLTAYANVTLGRNMQQGVDTGQFNFDPDELAYIDSRHIVLDHQPLVGVTAGASYDWKPWLFSADLTYSSGLRAGFADLVQLPATVQVNVAIQHTFAIPGVGDVADRLSILNVFDRTNLIRPAEGIGIFQSAYGPRFTVFNSITVPL